MKVAIIGDGKSHLVSQISKLLAENKHPEPVVLADMDEAMTYAKDSDDSNIVIIQPDKEESSNAGIIGRLSTVIASESFELFEPFKPEPVMMPIHAYDTDWNYNVSDYMPMPETKYGYPKSRNKPAKAIDENKKKAKRKAERKARKNHK